MLFRGLAACPSAPIELFPGLEEGAVASSEADGAIKSKAEAVGTSIESDMSKVSPIAIVIMGTCHSLFRDPRSGDIIGKDDRCNLI